MSFIHENKQLVIVLDENIIDGAGFESHSCLKIFFTFCLFFSFHREITDKLKNDFL